jgi:hypothetical protein
MVECHWDSGLFFSRWRLQLKSNATTKGFVVQLQIVTLGLWELLIKPTTVPTSSGCSQLYRRGGQVHPTGCRRILLNPNNPPPAEITSAQASVLDLRAWRIYGCGGGVTGRVTWQTHLQQHQLSARSPKLKIRVDPLERETHLRVGWQNSVDPSYFGMHDSHR